MSAEATPRINKLPFIIADLFLLGAAWVIVQYGHRPFGALEIFGVMLCVAIGGWFSFLPFLKQFESDQKLGEADRFASAVSKIQQLESIAVRIEVATAEWQALQEQSGRTAAIAKEVGERIAAEAKAFADFMQKANDTEKNHLRLEVDKLRRSENDWLQVVVRSLDHVFALYNGAIRSGQPKLIEQLGNFQAANRDLARRVGLNVFVAESAELFDPAKHQLPNPDEQVPDGALIGDTLAVGYTFQGQLVRRAVVTLQESTTHEPVPESDAPPQPADEPVEPVQTIEIIASTEVSVETDETEIRIVDAESGLEIVAREQATEPAATESATQSEASPETEPERLHESPSAPSSEPEFEDQTPLSAKDLRGRSAKKSTGPKQTSLF